MASPCFFSIREIRESILKREMSPTEVVQAFLDRIEERNPKVNAYITVLKEEALAKAKEKETELLRGHDAGPLFGVPVAVKDLSDHIEGVRHTFGCLPLKDYVSTFTSPCVERLEKAGAIILGKTNTPDQGHKGTTDNFIIGPTSTPFALDRNAGGSSGGSAAAVADGMATVALGSDGGGSIRIPASCCSVFGHKATFGRVPFTSEGVGFFHTPFVCNGPLARTVEDAAICFNVLKGPDPMEPMMLLDDGIDYVEVLKRPIKGLKIAYCPDFGVFPVTAEVQKITTEAALAFEEAGATVIGVGLKLKYTQEQLCHAWRQLYGVLSACSFELMKREGIDLIKDHADELPKELLENIEMGSTQSAVAYRILDVMRTHVFKAIQLVFRDYDLLITPTLAVPPVPNAAGGNTLGPSEINGEAVDPTIGWCLTYPVNFTGHPAASVPAGFTTEGLPVGMQLIGPLQRDDLIFTAAAQFEQIRPWKNRYPGLRAH